MIATAPTDLERPAGGKVKITYLPYDKSTRVPVGTTLFNAAHWIGLPIESTCGGRGTCGKCAVQVKGGIAEPSAADHRLLPNEDVVAGWRLACQATAQHDTVCRVSALMSVPKAATMGLSRVVLLEPNVQKILLEMAEPDLHDQVSDEDRILAALARQGYGARLDLGVLREMPARLRQAQFVLTAVLVGDEVIALEPGDTREECYGVAFDIGTTTVVGTLMNLRTGMAEGAASGLNSQAIAGADVISRISHANAGPEARRELNVAIVGTVNGLLHELLQRAGVSRERVYEAVVVGNATMLCLLFGVDPEPIAVSPFIPPFRSAKLFPADRLGIEIHPEGRVQSLPVIGAYVGADIVAGVLASGLAREKRMRLFIDVGTNGEIVLGSTDRILATAAPAGPAFEGAQIRCGMRAAPGAIEGVVLTDRVELQIIGGDVPPRGICGSGLVDAVAQLRLAGLLDGTGLLKRREEVPGHPLADHVIDLDGMRAFRLADDIVLTQRDIRELQFGKGSIAAGARVLMDLMGIGADDLDEVLLAGSFGSYINPDSARVIGLVPWVSLDKIISIGNAAGEGAKMSLVSFRERSVAIELPSAIEYVELSGCAAFNDIFIAVLQFPEPMTVG